MNQKLQSMLLGARGNPYHSGTLHKVLAKLDDEEQRVLAAIIDNIVEDAKRMESSRARTRGFVG